VRNWLQRAVDGEGMTFSAKVSKTGRWLLLGVLVLAGAPGAACSPPFRTCYQNRTCPPKAQGDAGEAGDESGGASDGGTQSTAGASGSGRGGASNGMGESGASGTGDGGDAGGSADPLNCAADQYNNGTSCQKLTVCATGEYQKTAPTSASDRVCAPWSVCPAGTSVSTQPSSTIDRACSPCAAGKFSSGVNAAQCTAWTQCLTGETESVAPSLASDRVCSKCGAGKYESGGQCLSLTACTAAQYESTPATASSDRKCSALTTCQPGSAQTAAPMATSDRQCAPCSAGQFSTQVNSTCKAWKVCTATQNQSMAGTATSDVVCVDKPGFLGGPCVTRTGGTGVEVFGRGDDKKIYRRVIDGSALGSWAVLGIDSRSDLDCAGGADSINIVAVGNNPQGALLRASGFGTTYGAFTRALAPNLFLPSASVATFAGSSYYWLAGLTTSSVYAENSSATPKVPNNLQNLPWSGLDTALLEGPSVSWYYLATFDSTAQLAVYILQQTQGGPVWLTPRELAPPPGKQYDRSPTICTWNIGWEVGETTVHLAVIAGGQLWHAYSMGGEVPFSAWEPTDPQVQATSAPDCATTPDGSVHIVALDSAAGVVKVSGSSGAFTTQRLGGH